PPLVASVLTLRVAVTGTLARSIVLKSPVLSACGLSKTFALPEYWRVVFSSEGSFAAPGTTAHLRMPAAARLSSPSKPSPATTQSRVLDCMVRPPICAPITLRVLGGLFGRIGRCPPVRADIGRA